ncbi:hypothetical protein LQ953_15755 [Sphingomonas sp. IC-56]|nr:hypothetical protein [Sphingomonas sp. IC-56]
MLRRERNSKAGYPLASAAALSLAALVLANCGRDAPDSVANNAQTEAPVATKAPVMPVALTPPQALTRGDLVSAAGQAASAYAEGKVPSAADPLVGRSFAVRLPFGCDGPAPAEAVAGEGDGLATWTWGPDRTTIQLRMAPSNWAGSAMLAKAGTSDQWEAVEGFWTPRPWLASERCPAVQVDPSQTGVPPASPQTVGLAAVFEQGGSRLGRRNGRPYEHTLRAKGDAPLTPPEGGFRMLLEGRIASFPNGRAIECRASGPDQRPICIVAIQLDRVAYEDAGGSVLSEWRPG